MFSYESHSQYAVVKMESERCNRLSNSRQNELPVESTPVYPDTEPFLPFGFMKLLMIKHLEDIFLNGKLQNLQVTASTHIAPIISPPAVPARGPHFYPCPSAPSDQVPSASCMEAPMWPRWQVLARLWASVGLGAARPPPGPPVQERWRQNEPREGIPFLEA